MRNIATGTGYECFSLLAQELTRIGLPQEAEALLSSIAAGSTGSECFGLAGQAIAELQSQHPQKAAGVLRPFIEPCIRTVQQAWPRYS